MFSRHKGFQVVAAGFLALPLAIKVTCFNINYCCLACFFYWNSGAFGEAARPRRCRQACPFTTAYRSCTVKRDEVKG